MFQWVADCPKEGLCDARYVGACHVTSGLALSLHYFVETLRELKPRGYKLKGLRQAPLGGGDHTKKNEMQKQYAMQT